jgi:Transferrin receptor-like dimerisation domain
VVFSPSSSNTYASSTFSGLTDLLETLGSQSEAEQPVKWAQVKQHLSVVTFLIEAAAKSLSDNF